VALATGCASTSAAPAFRDVAHEVETRSGQVVRWNPGSPEDAEAEKAVDALLARELTVDAAVQIALISNRSLRATFEELAIAQADLVQAGLLKNPVFTIGSTAWESEHIDPNLFATVEQDFLDIVTMPLRKRVAATELEARKLEVADEVLELAARVRHAYFTAQAAEQIVRVRRVVDEATQTSAEIARRQYAAGTMSELALQAELGLAAEASMERKRAEGDAAVAREALNQLMGLWGPRTAWTMVPRLPALPASEPALQRLESQAVAQRLDIASARRSVQAMEHALVLAKTTRWTGSVNVAVEIGRLRQEKHLAVGPSVSLEIPLFDQRQAQIARLEAYQRQAEHGLRALAVAVRADVRSSHARVATARSVALDYGQVVVPLRENVVRHSQERAGAMLLGVYDLLSAKRGELDAYREWVEAVRDYWIARSDLERAIGGRITAAPKDKQGGSK
jgi:cobalt-zinc-cadmium efflux system outer membrane protein